jgi:hypothetical protein
MKSSERDVPSNASSTIKIIAAMGKTSASDF